MLTIEEDIDRVIAMRRPGLEFAGNDELMANLECQEGGPLGVSRIEPDSQVVGRLGASPASGPETSRIGITREEPTHQARKPIAWAG